MYKVEFYCSQGMHLIGEQDIGFVFNVEVPMQTRKASNWITGYRVVHKMEFYCSH